MFRSKTIKSMSNFGSNKISIILFICITCLFLSYFQYHFLINTPYRSGSDNFDNDDEQMLDRIKDGISLNDFFEHHGGHLCPMLRITYYLCLKLEGAERWSPVFGSVLLLSHAFFCALVGIMIYLFGGSKAVGVGVACLMTVSSAFSSGLLSIFVNVGVYLIMILFLISIILQWKYIRTGLLQYYLLMILTMGISMLMLGSGILVFFIGGTFAFILLKAPIFAVSETYQIPESNSRFWKIVFGTGSLLLLYIILLLIGSNIYSNPMPYEIQHMAPSSYGIIDRFLSHLSYQLLGWVYPYIVIDDNITLPPWLFNNRVLIGFTLVVLFIFLLSCSLWSRKNNKIEINFSSSFALASLIVGILSVVMIISGRKYLYWWHMRYSAYGIVFFVLSTGITLSIIIKLLHGKIRFLFLTFLVFLFLYIVVINIEYVRKSSRYLNRITVVYNIEILNKFSAFSEVSQGCILIRHNG